MKRLLLLIFAVITTTLQAGVVSEHDALSKARQFMPGKTFEQPKEPNRASIRGEQSYAPAYYVFNAKDNDGFVIVSADDRTEAILGYADNGYFDENDIPLNVKAWLEFYENSIRSLDDSQIVSIPQRTAHASIEPLIKTKWGQGRPYNLQCPIEGENNCVTGCVATALAQVMYYHKWPASNSEQIPSYYTSTVGTLEALPTTTFKWDLMKNKYKYDATGDSVDAVAELMRYCGQINEMNYTNNGSSAFIHCDRLVTLFDYSNNIQNLNRSSFTNKQWEDIIYNDLANNLPVLYEGRNNNGGHQFICDGFDGNGLFHINWGWGGSYDGYYVLSLANPNGEGIGGSIGSDGYSNSQRAVIGFKPSTHDEQIIPRMTSYEVKLNISNYSRSTSDLFFEGVSLNGWINPIYNVTPDEEQSVETGWGLYQDNILIECIGYKIKTIRLYNSGAYLIDNDMTISFGASLENGRYQLCQVYRFPNETEWNLCDNQTNESLVIDIEDTKMFIRKIDSNNAQYTINEISYSEDPCIGHTLFVTLNLTNTGETTHEDIFLWTRLNGSESWTLATSALASLDPGETGNTTLQFTPSEAGINDIKITTDQFGENIMGAYSLAISDIVETTINGVTYSCIVNAKKAMVISYDSKTLPNEVVIPSTITNDGIVFSVISISKNAFQENTSIIQLTISEGVKSIESKAFYCCYSLEKVNLPSSLTKIEDYAFFSCRSIDTLIMPKGVSGIGYSTFRYCYGLRTIVLPSTINKIDEYAFGNCTALSSVIVRMNKPCEINENVFDISSSATLYVPVGTTELYKNAIEWKEFQSILEGELKEITIDGMTYAYATGSKVATLIKGQTDSSELIIPSSFSVDGVDIAVTTIGKQAFFNNNFITKLTISEGIKNIETSAFRYCYSLKQVDLPSSLTTIDDYAFGYCTALSSVIVRMNKPCEINENIFDISSSATLYVPVGSTELYKNAIEWKEFQSILEGEMKETTIDGMTYTYATGSKVATLIKGQTDSSELIIPSSFSVDGVDIAVTSIGRRAFYNNKSITKLTVSEGIINIGIDAFVMCYSLKRIVFPSSLRNIDGEAFWHCFNLDTLIIPEGVISIGQYAFRYCDGLQLILLPSTITEIDRYAFGNCSNLKTITVCMDNPCAINENVFGISQWNDDVETILPSTAALCVPAGTASKYQETAGWNAFDIIAEPVVVTAKNYTIQYGEELPDLKYTSEGVELNGTPQINCTATTHSPVGTYPIVISKGSVSNYNDTYIDGTLTIIKTPLTITANDYIIWQDDVIPELSVSYQGFKNDEDATVLTTTPVLTSEVTSSSEPGVYTITISDAEAQNYEINYLPGKLTINERIPGDVTANGIVDIQDATIAVNYILGERLNKYVYYMADMNKDDEIDVFDITAIINVILRKNNFMAPIRSSYNKYNEYHPNLSSTPQKSLEDVYLRTVYDKISFSIDNPERFTSFQMDLEVTDGAELTTVEFKGSNNTHIIQSAVIGENLYRIIALSMNNQPLAKEQNELINFQLDNSASNELKIRNIMFVTSKGDVHYFNDLSEMTPTRKHIIPAESEDIIYDLSGKRIYKKVKDLSNGIYIINNEKVIIK